ncbi:MAG: PqqD family peptide modification chaperone [Candidatus Competibacteraceae bacterium]|nr:PqqD family peptide modification chaperone [Candidatus Competibacteraceae bacterium]
MAFPLEDGLVLMRPGVDRLFVLNATASGIWSDYAQNLPPAAIAARLARRFDIAADQAARDVRAALADWEREGLLDFQFGDMRLEATPPATPFGVEAPVVECTYRLVGTTFRIRYGEPMFHQRLHPLLRHWVTTSTVNLQTTFEVCATATDYEWRQEGDEASLYCATVDELIQQALYRIVEYACRQIPWLAFFHAAALGDGASCIVLPGLSGSGKTTLAAALLQSGFEYLGDETIPLRRDNGRIVPLPGPLCLKSGSWPALAAYYPTLDTWPIYHRWGQPVRYLLPRSTDPDRSWPVRTLIFPRYVPGGATVLQPIAATAALQYLMAADTRLPQPLMPADVSAFVAWLSGAPAYTLTYDNLAEAVTAVRELLLDESQELNREANRGEL